VRSHSTFVLTQRRLAVAAVAFPVVYTLYPQQPNLVLVYLFSSALRRALGGPLPLS
jgi:hypothetical protein